MRIATVASQVARLADVSLRYPDAVQCSVPIDGFARGTTSTMMPLSMFFVATHTS